MSTSAEGNRRESSGGLCPLDPLADVRSAEPLDRHQISPVSTARLDRMPLPGGILESTTPFRQIRAVLSMSRSVLGLDQPEALPGKQAECVGVVLHM